VVGSCLTAAAIWRLPIPTSGLDVHVCAPKQVRRPGFTAHRRAAPEARIVDGLPVTSPVQTFLDLGAEVDGTWLVVIGDAMVQRRLVQIGDLRAGVETAGADRGIRRARSAALLVRAGAESPMESLLRLTIVNAGLPEPLGNVDARDSHGGWLARVDLSYPDRRIAIEYQGDHHRSDVRQWRDDIARTRALQACGWMVIFATVDDLRAPTHLLASISRALRHRGAGAE
jgi:hypothetical protein